MAEPNNRFALRADVRAAAPRKGEVRITSAITRYKWDEDDVTSNDFHRKLEALGELDEITVRINSPGGAVSEAVAIRSELMRNKAAKTIEIEGMCASAATIIACMPGARVRMAEGSEYMIHRCLYGAWGHADEVLAAYNSMMVTDGNLAKIYAERTGKSEEECAALMRAESWFTPEQAVEAGFADEAYSPGEGEAGMVACQMDKDAMALMRATYANVPDLPEWTAENDVSNEQSAVAAEHSTENNHEGAENMDELRNATAEQLMTENPALAETIAQQAVAAERERMQKIDKLTPKGAKFAALAKKAKEEGTSVQDYLEQVIAAQEQAGEDYLEARRKELEPANGVGSGDAKDNDDDAETKADKAAKEIAEIAKGMSADVAEMA